MPSSFAFDDPDAALETIANKLSIVPVERSTSDTDQGRVLGQAVVADRDSPAADVSAMDGYAVRIDDLKSGIDTPIQGESACGSPPPKMPPQGVVRIFTGAIVPEGCEAVIKREETTESPDSVRFSDSACQNPVGANIRRAGENSPAGSVVLPSGVLISAATQAAMANFGCFQRDIHRPVRVSLITTGDEVLSEDQTPQPWQLRNSNQVALKTLFQGHPWIQLQTVEHCVDGRERITETLSRCLAESDAVITTGGVSMGDYDYVPDVVRDCGGQIVFHGLPIRPGKPILGAATQEGKLIIGLPGNPVSALVNARRMVTPLLAKISGQTRWLSPSPMVELARAQIRTLPLHQMLLVRLTHPGQAELVPAKGSGDLVALSQSDGFVQIPPGDIDPQPRPFYSWT